MPDDTTPDPQPAQPPDGSEPLDVFWQYVQAMETSKYGREGRRPHDLRRPFVPPAPRPRNRPVSSDPDDPY